MILAFWLLFPVVLVLAIGVGLSFYLTSRKPLTEIHSPEEFGLEFSEVIFEATDGLKLHGCLIPVQNSDRVIVILHGHGGSLDWDIHRAPALHEAGFNVFLFDFRAHGRSQGHLATFGYLERQDVKGAINFLKNQGLRRIGLLGFSYGGIASMLATPICPEVNAVITDGGPTRMRTAITARGVELHLPHWLAAFLAWLVLVITSMRLCVNLFSFEPVRWVGKITPRPILFIHGDLDQYCSDFDDLYSETGEPKDLWRLQNVGHTQASNVHPDEFRRRVIEFFKRYL